MRNHVDHIYGFYYQMCYTTIKKVVNKLMFIYVFVCVLQYDVVMCCQPGVVSDL